MERGGPQVAEKGQPTQFCQGVRDYKDNLTAAWGFGEKRRGKEKKRDEGEEEFREEQQVKGREASKRGFGKHQTDMKLNYVSGAQL